MTLRTKRRCDQEQENMKGTFGVSVFMREAHVDDYFHKEPGDSEASYE